jgi:endonuclease/exonuclease/phosphatase family metal-dependent hydrolase
MGLCISSSQAFADQIRVATWNINNLNDKSGVPLRDRAPIREDNDYVLLQKYAAELDADIISLQEMGNPAAVRRVFPESDWELYFSGRYSPANPPDIYTAVVVRKGRVEVLEHADYTPLQITDNEGYSTRRGVQLLLKAGGTQFWLLGVHMKSSCHGQSLAPPSTEDCKILAQQIAPLEAWIDQKEASGLPVIIAGDFNRRFDLHGQTDHLWEAIDDSDPPSLNLWRMPYRTPSSCPTISAGMREHPIDFIVMNEVAWALADQQSFAEVIYDEVEAEALGNRLSDHCAVSININLP